MSFGGFLPSFTEFSSVVGFIDDTELNFYRILLFFSLKLGKNQIVPKGTACLPCGGFLPSFTEFSTIVGFIDATEMNLYRVLLVVITALKGRH